jgi:hypothetical protein
VIWFTDSSARPLAKEPRYRHKPQNPPKGDSVSAIYGPFALQGGSFLTCGSLKRRRARDLYFRRARKRSHLGFLSRIGWHILHPC